MDTTTASGELPFHVFGALAQYERALTRERVVAGLAAARRRGRIGGQPPAITCEKLDAIVAALNEGMSKAAVCRNFGVKRTTLIETLARLSVPTRNAFTQTFMGRLPPAVCERLDELLGPAPNNGDRSATEDIYGHTPAALLRLRSNQGRPSLASMQEELAKLDIIRGIVLPTDLFEHVSSRERERCRRRVAVEAPYALRRHRSPAHLAGRLCLSTGSQLDRRSDRPVD
jgi:hypothetical protein